MRKKRIMRKKATINGLHCVLSAYNLRIRGPLPLPVSAKQ